MKTYHKLRFILVSMALGGLAMLQWTCGIEKIGLQEPSPIPISEIVSELANAQTQAQAEFAMDLILKKTGVGTQIVGSRYGDYFLDENIVANVVQTHLRTLREPRFRLTWQEVFELEQILPEGDWLSPVVFDDVRQRFKEEATLALRDPEAPNNAVMLAIMAKDGIIPTSVPDLGGEEELLGIQDFLLTVWIHYEFQVLEILPKQSTTDNDITFKVIEEVKCEAGEPEEIDDIEKDKFEVDYFSRNHKTCLKAGRKMYKRLIKKDCLRKKKDKDCTNEIVPCVDKANMFLKDWIEIVCDDFIIHDQGSFDPDP